MFDLDGTLVNSEGMAQDVILREINNRLHLEMSKEVYDAAYLGRDVVFMEQDLAERYGRDLPSDFMKSLGDTYHAAVVTDLEASTNIEEVLGQIQLPMCIVSNSDPGSIQLSIESVGLAHFFSGNHFSGVEVSRSKPHPDVYVEAAKSMGFDPAECLAIEDSVTGMAAARAAGCQLLGYAGNTVGHAAEFENSGVVVINDFKELLDLIA